MAKFNSVLAILTLAVSSGQVLGAQSCLLETNAAFMGMQLDIKDCIENAGMTADDFKAQCEGMSQAVVAMGGPAAKITYLSACPLPFQAKCDSSGLAKSVFFYYKRAPEEVAGLQSGCELMQGKYTKGTLQ